MFKCNKMSFIVMVIYLLNCLFYVIYFRSYLDKTISLHLNKGRKVTGTLLGYDQFMNIVLGDTREELSNADDKNIGMVVSFILIVFLMG